MPEPAPANASPVHQPGLPLLLTTFYLLLSEIDLPDAGLMPSSVKWCRKPDSDDGERLLLGDRSLAEGEAVGVVVRPAQPRDLLIPAQAAADPPHAVGNHSLAVAGAAEDDAPLELAAGDRLGDGADEVGVVAGDLRVGAEIAHRVALGEEHGLDGLLVPVAGVVGPDRDGEGHGGWRRLGPPPVTFNPSRAPALS